MGAGEARGGGHGAECALDRRQIEPLRLTGARLPPCGPKGVSGVELAGNGQVLAPGPWPCPAPRPRCACVEPCGQPGVMGRASFNISPAVALCARRCGAKASPSTAIRSASGKVGSADVARQPRSHLKAPPVR